MKTVCVTGASGYIASWIVKLLLQRGYTVKACVRDLNDPKKTQHLLALDGAKERLQLIKANLLDEGSFDAAVDGCDGVFHTASPFHDPGDNPQAELIDPALKGTLNVLGSCAKSPTLKRVVLTASVGSVYVNERTRSPEVVIDETWWSDLDFCRRTQADLIDPALKGTLNVLGSCAKTPSVKRVVLTSSIVAVFFNGKPRTPEVVVDETWWSDPEFCKQMQQWYMLSKTLAEDAAWKFVKEKGIDMVAINPSMVIGPLLQPTLNTSSASILNLINGAKAYPNLTAGWVNVKDVANAHVLAYENPSANGRYCMVESVAHFSEVVKILHELYPNLQLPEKCANDKPLTPTYQVSKERAKSLGVEFTPLKESLKETAESLKEKNFFKAQPAI
ncbi:UNVERIFIED_CONTAM: Cinnamoyl-CoA reductase 1 [Sesamum latifolium]|uniref:Dihydroflavonol 4-reductase n=1 Tax=Sesamum latifolium TaxID=2727402 RepID=A0AAW2XZP1_9LAMI